MRRTSLMILVCLYFVASSFHEASAQQDFLDVIVQPDYSQFGQSSTNQYPESSFFARASAGSGNPFAIGGQSSGKPITKCKPDLPCPPPQCEPVCEKCVLPVRYMGQWEPTIQVLFANVRGTAHYPAVVNGISTSDLDFNTDLDLPRHQVLLEYGVRYQFRPHWAFLYSIMPISLEGNKTLERDVYFGQWLVPRGTHLNTKYVYTYQRLGIMYQPIVNCNATVSIFGGWTFNQHWLRVQSIVCGGRASTIDRTRHMAFSGMEIQKCIKTYCNGATLSCDNRVGLSYLDGTLGVDARTGLQYSVPMGDGRWGFARGGYRWVNFTEDRVDLRLDTYLDGGFVEAGLIF